jgi:type IX secretion system PorP/SprF family membrane protein
MFNKLGVNPAYAGSRDALSMGLVHRNQWVSMPGAPVTNALIAHMPLKGNKMGVGLEITNDKIGPKTQNYINLDYAYKIKAGKGKLAFGIRAGIISYNYDWSKIEYKNENDGYLQYVYTSNFTVPNFDFGLYYNTAKFYAGLAFAHLNRAAYDVLTQQLSDSVSSRLYRHSTLTLGRAFVLNDKWVLRTSMLIRSVEGGLANLDLNFSILYNNKIWAGMSLRSTNDVVLMIEFNPNKKIRIGYAYDYNAGKLRTYTGGTHEIFIGYDLQLKNVKMMSPRYF